LYSKIYGNKKLFFRRLRFFYGSDEQRFFFCGKPY
jgi:hypothetical protein